MIKQAILGDPRQIVNGQRAISGFVADMGRLPVNLHELLEKEYCSDRSYSDQVTCEAASKTWNTQTDWGQHTVSGLWFGWHGPYLNVSDSALDDTAFGDTWGNVAADKAVHNYGWSWLTNTPGTNDLTIVSYGKDQVNSGSCSDSDYNGDCFQQILSADYQVDMSPGITVSMKGRTFSMDSRCSNAAYTARTNCETNGGIWYGGCSEGIAGSPSYANKDTCSAPKTWSSCSITTHTTKADCETNNGIWYGDGYGCSDGVSPDKAACGAPKTWYGCSDNTKGDRVACEAASANWFGDGSTVGTRLICLKVYHHQNESVASISADSTPSIVEDNSLQHLTFNFPVNSLVNVGTASIAIYYQRGAQCMTSIPYPLDSKPLPITIYPRTPLPVINW